jgi:hypothetical protein
LKYLLFLLIANSLFANGVKELQKKAIDLKLYESREWHLLLHYKNGESLIDDELFFISENGKHDPKSELEATIDAFFQDSYEDGNLSARCIFVERFRWLDSKLNLGIKEKCERFETWFDEVQGEKMSLIFASSYMNNPSSMFGHTFLRVDKKDKPLQLSYALNYSASTGNDGGFAFAFRGIFGGYPAYFSVAPYFEKIRQYNDLENRDLYEYSLNLTEEEVEKILYHTWELHFFHSDYFFFKENCSYNILTLLEYARPSLNLTQHFSAFAIPSDTVRVLSENNLVSEVVYRPSKKSEIVNLLENSSEKAKEFAKEISYQELEPKEILEMNISKVEKMDTLELAYSYIDYLRLKKDYDFENPQKQQMKTLIARSKIGNRDTKLPSPKKPKYNTEDGHKVSRVKIGYSNRDGENISSLGIKPSYHQILDNQIGYIDGAEISFFDLELDIGDEVQYQMDFLKIKSYSSYGEFFKPKSWEFSTGIQNQFELQKPIYYINGGAGLTFGDRVKLFSLATLDFEHSKNYSKENMFLVGAKIGVFSTVNENWRTLLVGDFKSSETENRNSLSFQNNFFLNVDNSILLDLSFEDREKSFYTISLQYQHYF